MLASFDLMGDNLHLMARLETLKRQIMIRHVVFRRSQEPLTRLRGSMTSPPRPLWLIWSLRISVSSFRLLGQEKYLSGRMVEFVENPLTRFDEEVRLARAYDQWVSLNSHQTCMSCVRHGRAVRLMQ